MSEANTVENSDILVIEPEVSEVPSIIETCTLLTPEINFGSIDAAQDYFNKREIVPVVYQGNQLSVDIREGESLLNISGTEGVESFPLRDSGLETLFQKTGLGSGNFQMHVAGPELLEHNLNYLLKNQVAKKDFSVIFDKNPNDPGYGIKSVMSDTYQHVDHAKLFEVIEGLKIDFKVRNLQLTRDFFRMCITNPMNKVVSPVVGDVSDIGIDLLNSENGRASLWMAEYLYRYWCSNGASHIDENSSNRSRAIHRGNIDKAFGDFKKSAKQYLENGAEIMTQNFKVLSEKKATKKIVKKVHDKVEKIVGKKSSERIIQEWEITANRSKYDSTEWAIKPEDTVDNNCYQLSQLVTRVAHEGPKTIEKHIPTATQRVALERVGGWMYNNPGALMN